MVNHLEQPHLSLGRKLALLNVKKAQNFYNNVKNLVPDLEANNLAYSIAYNLDDWDKFLDSWIMVDYMHSGKSFRSSTLVSEDPDNYAINDEDADYLAEETFLKR